MELIADILLVAGALGAGLYCFVLARRLRRFTDLEKGVGGAVSVLSTQAGELKKSLDNAQEASDQSGIRLNDLTQRAENVAQRLELIMASMHDLVPEEQPDPDVAPEPEAPSQDPRPNAEPKVKEESSTTAAQEEKPARTPTDARPPEGLMFFRHTRAQPEAAQ